MRGAAQALTRRHDGRVSRRALRSRREVRGDHGRGGAAARESGAARPSARPRGARGAVRRARHRGAAASSAPASCRYELFEKTVEPTLQAPVFVTQYPAEVSPLARCNDADPFVTDRFELFIGGREIANGFSELNDPEEQARAVSRAGRSEGRRATRKRCFSTRTTSARSSTACRRPAGLGVGIDRLAMLFDELAVDPRRAVVPAAEARNLVARHRRTAAAARRSRCAVRTSTA